MTEQVDILHIPKKQCPKCGYTGYNGRPALRKSRIDGTERCRSCLEVIKKPRIIMIEVRRSVRFHGARIQA